MKRAFVRHRKTSFKFSLVSKLTYSLDCFSEKRNSKFEAFLSTCTHTFDMASRATNRGFNEQVKWERVNLICFREKGPQTVQNFSITIVCCRTPISPNCGKRSYILNNETKWCPGEHPGYITEAIFCLIVRFQTAKTSNFLFPACSVFPRPRNWEFYFSASTHSCK